ncbi:ABC transporter [Phlyctema vagabunda]|uniref:ABC transporter n=1 Tax=Phlyctema vagabunda TaxID=108571 RepID=A0ABR4PLF0_9HELO
MAFSGCQDDNSFGPSVRGCRDGFDFTIKFERIFLSLVPSCIFIIVGLARVGFLIRKPEIVKGSSLRNVKLAATITYCILELSLLVLSLTGAKQRPLSVAATAASFASSLSIIAISFTEHSHSPRPSILLNSYLFLTVLFDVVQARTFWLAFVDAHEFTFTRIFTAAVAVKGALILLESEHKSKWVQWEVEKHSPEETSGIFGLSAFAWLKQMFLAGYTKILVLDDLFPLDQSMTTEALQLKLLERVRFSKPKGGRFGLAKALAKTLVGSLLLPIGPRAALIGFKFCQPFLINTLLDFLQQPAGDSSKNSGYGLIGATVIIYSGITISTGLYWYLQERTLCMCRGSLAGAIYKKTTEVKLSAAGDSAALTLMSTDVERIRLGFLYLHEFWANSIEVALATWLLQRQLGTAFVAPLVVILICIVGGGFTNKFTGERQRAWMDKIQKRIGLTANVISNMKHLKISGLAGPVEDLIQHMRVDELETASRFRTVYVTVITFGYTPLALCPVITFAVTSRTLDVSTIFTSLSYLLLLADPLGYLFQNSPNLLAAFTCLDRIQAFLEQDPRVDFRMCDLQGPSVIIEEKGHISEANFDQPECMITIDRGNFGWEADRMILKDINLSISTSQLTMVVGPVASGKSTLCKVLLGEVPVSDALVSMESSFASQRVGYCDQTPYLSNVSIRENIVGFSPMNQSRYREVLEATMLLPDLSILPKGDETRIGSNGISLSGGQKQRVSMARALYLDSDFFIFDDILSGLDGDTEEQVFNRVFGPDGLLKRRNSTIVLCTHNVRHLSSADHIIALGAGGTIVEQGSFQSLITNESYIQSLDIKPKGNAKSIDGNIPTEPSRALGVEPVDISTVESVMTSYTNKKDRMMGDSTVHRHYLKSLGKRSIVAFIVFGLGWGFFYNWGNVWLELWSKDVGSARPSRSNGFYISLYALFQMSYLASMFFVFIICFRTMIQTSGAKLHKDALRTMVRAPLNFFTTTDTGLVTNLFSQDMTLIDNELPIAVTNLALDVCNALGMAAVIASSSPYLAITYPFLFAILWGIQKFYLRTSRQLRLLDLEAKSPLYTHFLDTIKDVATFRAFGWVQEGININNTLLDTSQRPAYLLAMVQRWLGFALQTVVAFLAVAVVTLATQLRSNTGLTGASLVTLMTFGDILNYIIRWWTQIETSIGAVSRLKNFSEKVKSESFEDEDVIPPTEWPLRGNIQISGVSASYDGIENSVRDSTSSRHGSPTNLALKDLNLVIQPGEKLAICGRSGSGKSSMILLLLRLLNPLGSCSQNITIDDIPLHKIDRTTLRQRIIAIPQDPVFLPSGTSFMSNLDPFNTSTALECQSVLETVGLWPLIEQRGGLDEGMSADTLSQGQKQLFSLARAILRRRICARQREAQFGTATKRGNSTGILLLDEVSSSVDQETDRIIQNIIRVEFESYTIIMVSHRLEMVLGFDTVLVMNQGSVVEKGAPSTLVESEGSRFRELWLIQNNC